MSLQPRQQQVDFFSLAVWQRLGSSPAATLHTGTSAVEDDDEFFPGDFQETLKAEKSNLVLPPASQLFERVTKPVPAMRACMLAILNCDPEPDSPQTDLLTSAVMGFLNVTDVDKARGKITLLSPVAGPVPSRAMVWHGVESYVEF